MRVLESVSQFQMTSDNLETLDTFTTKQDVTVTSLMAQMETLSLDGA